MAYENVDIGSEEDIEIFIQQMHAERLSFRISKNSSVQVLRLKVRDATVSFLIIR